MRLPICALVLALGAAPAVAGPRDPLYSWTDANGAVRYTTERERIPNEQRKQATVVAAEHTAPPAAPAPVPAATAPAPAAAPAAPPSPTPSSVDSAPPAAAAPVTSEVADLDARIAELEKQIAADEAALGDYISDPERTKQGATSDVTEIAERMPKLQNELRELRRQREAAASAAPNASSP
jgi:hypothetical protein